jgi:tetratricopeptide (TPR) repeat protein
MVSLARILLERARYDEAEQYYHQSIDIFRETVGPDHPVLGIVMNDLGLLMYERGAYLQADSLLSESFTFQRAATAGVERNPMSVAMVRRAQALAALGQLAMADSLAEAGVGLSRRLHEDRSMWLAGSLAVLADVRRQEGATAEAESLFAGSLERMRSFEESGDDRPRESASLLGLARCRLALGNTSGAEAASREALAIEQRYRRPGHPDTARAQIVLAEVLIAQGHAAQAQALLREAVATLSPLVLPRQIDLVAAQTLLGESNAGAR